MLGVYFGNDLYVNKNWEGLVDRVNGRLQRWRWLLSQLSFRGRCLVINNLIASMLWHKFTVLDPPKDLLKSVQKALVNFFWDGCHWLPPRSPLSSSGRGRSRAYTSGVKDLGNEDANIAEIIV